MGPVSNNSILHVAIEMNDGQLKDVYAYLFLLLRTVGRLCGLDGVCFQTFGLVNVGARSSVNSARAWLQAMDGSGDGRW